MSDPQKFTERWTLTIVYLVAAALIIGLYSAGWLT